MGNEIKKINIKKGLIIFLSIITVALVGYIIYDKLIAPKKVIDNKSSEKPSSSDKNSSSEEKTEVFWKNLIGFWNIYNEAEIELLFIQFSNDKTDKLLTFAHWYSDDGEVGKVVDISFKNENLYELKINYVGGVNQFGEVFEARNIILYVDITNIKNKEIKILATEDDPEPMIFKYSGSTLSEAIPPLE